MSIVRGDVTSKLSVVLDMLKHHIEWLRTICRIDVQILMLQLNVDLTVSDIVKCAAIVDLCDRQCITRL
jgi:hypothetical protein